MKVNDHQKELITSDTLSPIQLQSKNQNPYIHLGTSENTRKAYRSDIRHFENWGGKLPASSQQIVEYLKYYADKINPRTLERRLVAISHWHNYQNFTDPTRNSTIQKTLKGIRRAHGNPQQKAHAISLEELSCIHNYLSEQNSLAALRDDALFLIGFFGAFRRSELVNIQVEHIQWKKEGIVITMPKSKTDQENIGTTVFIPFANSELCPIVSLKKWITAANIKIGALFRRIAKNANIADEALTPLSVSLLLKKRYAEIDIVTRNPVSGHSLRRGLATCAAKAGAPLQTIMRSGRWKQTSTVLEYIEEANSFKENVLCHIIKSKGL